MVAVIQRKIRVILADGHPVVRDGLAAMVNQQADMEVVAEAGDGEEAIALYEFLGSLPRYSFLPVTRFSPDVHDGDDPYGVWLCDVYHCVGKSVGE